MPSLLLKCAVLIACLGPVVGCKLQVDIPEPSPITYQLTATELAWQGYANGQELRFGRDGSGRVRIFKVLVKQDVLATQWRPGGWLPLPTAERLYQHIKVTGQRTDSIIYRKSISSADSTMVTDVWLDLYKYENRSGALETRADIGWSYWFSSTLPIESLATSQFTSGNGIELLSAIKLGPTTYEQVVKISRQLSAPTPQTITQVYYAKGLGVVAYEEAGTGLWYRLP